MNLFFLGSWLRKEEAKQEESNSGKREVVREGERVEIKRRCWERLSSNVFEDIKSMVEGESDGCACCVVI